ncbi:hypothetical protein NQ318_009115 [Aromia moschata]|uniref:Uncharacterized protein n=1 Tax=Aromia moschata TaxID=1265417 RepID=A0AAV8XQ71_9CUCU|nr:hypothetical protein NQ318_009115 [Aromia moschata]
MMRGRSDAEFEDEAHHMPPLTPAPAPYDKPKDKDDAGATDLVKIAPKPPPPKANSNLQIPIQTGIRTANGITPPLPFPLLILKGLPNAAAPTAQSLQAIGATKKTASCAGAGTSQPDISSILKNLLEVQKENLEVEKQRLELEKQKMEFERLVGTQLLTLLPMFGGLLQRLAFPNLPSDNGNSSDADSPPKKNSRKRQSPDSGFDILKDSKILRNVLEQGIKKYMLGEHHANSNSDNEEDSGIHNDENSSASSK